MDHRLSAGVASAALRSAGQIQNHHHQFHHHNSNNPTANGISSAAHSAQSAGGGAIISEHLSRILKQYEMSAMNSLKGPASVVASTANVQPSNSSRSQPPPEHIRIAHASPSTNRRSSVPGDRHQYAHPRQPMPAAPQLGDEVWSVLAAMAGALRPPSQLNLLTSLPAQAPLMNPLTSPFFPPTFSNLPAASAAASLGVKDLRASETVLEDSRITCFDVGGEKRLCLPQVLNLVLRDFSLQEINDACGNLNIHCSQCTKQQLDILKLLAVLPLNAVSCGLITKTDAERLTSYLLDQRLIVPLDASLSQRAPPVTVAASTTNSNAAFDADDASVSTTSAVSPSSSTSTRTAFSATPPAVHHANSADDDAATARPSTNDEPAPAEPHYGSASSDDDAEPSTTVAALNETHAAKEMHEASEAEATIEPVEPEPEPGPDADLLPIYHECFGRCRGTWQRSAYTSPDAECIRCDECQRALAPRRFALHSHRSSRESRTCHWGFDPANWRHYVYAGHIVGAGKEMRERIEKLLDLEKAKFQIASPLVVDGKSGVAVAPTPAAVAYQKRSLSDEARADAAYSQPPEKKSRYSNTNNTNGVLNGSANQGALPLTVPNAAQSLPLIMYDQLLIYQAMLAAQLGAYSPTALLPMMSPKQISHQPSAIEEAAAAALLKLAPQINEASLKSSCLEAKFKQLSAASSLIMPVKDGSISSSLNNSNNHNLQHHDISPPTATVPPAAHSSCIEPLKKHILHRSMMARANTATSNNGSAAPPANQHSFQQLVQQQQQLLAAKQMVNATADISPRGSGGRPSSEAIDNLETMLEQHIGDQEALRRVRTKLDEARRQVDTRLDTLASENRVLKREIEVLRTLSQIGAGGSAAGFLAAGIMP